MIIGVPRSCSLGRVKQDLSASRQFLCIPQCLLSSLPQSHLEPEQVIPRNTSQCSSPLNKMPRPPAFLKVIITGHMGTVLPGTGSLLCEVGQSRFTDLFIFFFKLSTSLTRGLKQAAFRLQKHLKCNMLMLVWSLVHFHKKPTISPTTP